MTWKCETCGEENRLFQDACPKCGNPILRDESVKRSKKEGKE